MFFFNKNVSWSMVKYHFTKNTINLIPMGHIQNPPAIKIHLIKINPHKNLSNQNQPEQKLTRSTSTCLIQPKSTKGQNCTSHFCKGVDFLAGCVFLALPHFSM